jgi:hypothetical protein
MTTRGTTAEWNCTNCATTNRKLVPFGTAEVKDRCVHCRTHHVVTIGDRPTRWEARRKT